MDSAVVLVGPPAPCRFIRAIPAGTCLLGRSSRCSLIVDDPSVSRWHARLSHRDGRVRVVDLGSRNGTFVDDVPIRDAEVTCGRRLRFGDVPFQVTSRDEVHRELDGSLEACGTPPGHRPSPLRPAANCLTGAQQQVLNLLSQGLQEKTIAKRLRVSSHTVHAHVGAIYKTLHVHSRSELMAYVLQQRLVIVNHDAPARPEPLPVRPLAVERSATALRLFYLSREECDDYRRILDELGLAYHETDICLQIDGPVMPVVMRGLMAALRSYQWVD